MGTNSSIIYMKTRDGYKYIAKDIDTNYKAQRRYCHLPTPKNGRVSQYQHNICCSQKLHYIIFYKRLRILSRTRVA